MVQKTAQSIGELTTWRLSQNILRQYILFSRRRLHAIQYQFKGWRRLKITYNSRQNISYSFAIGYAQFGCFSICLAACHRSIRPMNVSVTCHRLQQSMKGLDFRCMCRRMTWMQQSIACCRMSRVVGSDDLPCNQDCVFQEECWTWKEKPCK